MATVTLFTGFSFLQPQDWDFVVASNTSTSLVLANSALGLQQSFTGTFSYDTLGNVSGRVTETTFSSGGNAVYTATGLDRSAGRLQDYAEGVGDTQQMYAFVLQGDDTIFGSDFADTLYGYGGNDSMEGGVGDDVLHGGAGIDTMNGAFGNDTYYVGNTGDRVFEFTPSGFDSGGVDRVFATVSHTLAMNVEHLTLTGSTAINGTGNSLANAVTGNSAVNTLRGGGAGDVLRGGGGNDVLIGGQGADSLFGGLGNDTFDFNLQSELHANLFATDTVRDFVQGQDKLDVANLDANGALAGNTAFSFIGNGAFSGNATGQVRFFTDAVSRQTIVEFSTDADAAVEFAIVLTGMKTMLASDFVL